MLNGPFMESQLGKINLKIDDNLITKEAFKIVIDSFYSCELNLNKSNIYNITATARYLQMEEVIECCERKLLEILNERNCLDIYHLTDKYGLINTKNYVFQWLLLKLMPIKSYDVLESMTIELAEKLVNSPRLVAPSEFYIYTVMKYFIQICDKRRVITKNDLNATGFPKITLDNNYYKKMKNNKKAFLLTREGVKYASIFKALRIRNLLVRPNELIKVRDDNIIPKEWIEEWTNENWLALMAIETSDNLGPCPRLVTIDDFEKNAMRFAKVMSKPDWYNWKFQAFGFGIDLAFTFNGRNILVKRVHHMNQMKILNSHEKRRIMLRWEMIETEGILDVNRQSEIITITLRPNEEFVLAGLKIEPKYPCLFSVEVLYVIPKTFQKLSWTMDDNIVEPALTEADQTLNSPELPRLIIPRINDTTEATYDTDTSTASHDSDSSDESEDEFERYKIPFSWDVRWKELCQNN